jgi:DNA polymerase III subunit alpha
MSKYNFVHLHNHTEYSLLDGMIPVDKLASAAKQNGMNSVAITDHGNMYGVIDFYEKCKEEGIKPIIGSEFYVSPTTRFDRSGRNSQHLILLAKSETGYKNLINLSSASFIEGFYYNPRIDKELLEKYSKDLVCLSACIGGEIPRLILEGKIQEAEKSAMFYQEIFGKDSFFLELQIHGIKEEKVVAKNLFSMSKKLQIPLVATNDCHYLRKDDAEAQDVLLCIGTKKHISDSQRMRFHGEEFYFKTEEEMSVIFGELPKSLSNTQFIAEMCNIDIKLPGPILPEFEVPADHTKESYLKKIAHEGMTKRYDNIPQELEKRFEMEIDVINRMGFAGYFLIVWDFIKYANEKNIWVGPGRGSGAGSIVAYSLGITNIDPIKYDLIFERFLNEKRVSMPDFDIDFCQERRQEVIDYVIEKYSKEKVSQIVTFSKMKAKAVIRDVGRVLEIPLDRVNQIVGMLPEFEKGDNLKTVSEKIPELKQIKNFGTNEEKKLLEVSARLENMTRHTSVHAAGVVIGQKEITEYVPLQIVKDEKAGDIITTQFPGTQLEKCGLVKMDFLGLITLTLMRNCLELIENKGIKIDINNISFEDPKVYDLFSRGDTDAIFQFESPGMKKYLMKLKPTCLSDLIAMNALYRPGPMNFIDTYIQRKNGIEKVVYDHQLMEPILKETFGIMIYQEQVMKIAQVLAGYDLGSADILRRAMGKKKAEEMKKHSKIFVYGNQKEVQEALEKGEKPPTEVKGAISNGIEKDVAENIFNKMQDFANYGFNKSHAAAYAYLAYQTAFLKTYHPVEFMASVLSSEIGRPDKLLLYIEGLKDLGIVMLPPDINFSDVIFSVEDDKIRYALNGIKGVGESASKSITTARKNEGGFKSFIHFLQSVDLRLVNHGVLEILIKCGALDSLGHKRKWMSDHLTDSIIEAQGRQSDKKIGQSGLFENFLEKDVDNKTKPGVDVEEWNEKEKLFMEKEILGFFISGHPLKKFALYLRQNCNHSSKTLKQIVCKAENGYMHRIPVAMAGIVDSVKIFKSDENTSWAIMTVEDLEGKFEVFVYKSQYEEYSSHLVNKKNIFLKGYCKMGQNEKKVVVADSIFDLEEKQNKSISEYHVFLKELEIDDELLANFRNDLDTLHGDLSIFFHIKTDEENETVVKAMNTKAPKDESIQKVFIEKYNFIEKIKIV